MSKALDCTTDIGTIIIAGKIPVLIYLKEYLNLKQELVDM
jgi:hypothetical protein